MPLFAEDIERMATVEAEATPKPAIAPVVPEQLPVAGVGNLRAIGVTVAAAALALLGILVIGRLVPPSVPLILCAAGFAAARFYGARRAISALNGAILGTMTGLWLFFVFAICLGTASVAFSTPEGQAVIKGLPQQEQVIRLLQDPHQMVTGFLLPVFFFLIVSSAFGGLLAVSTRRPSR
jgi:Na+/proline symporter